MANDTNRRSYTFDADLQLKDAGLVAASAAAQVDSADQILDVGTSVFDGVAVIDVTAIEIASNDEHYRIAIQGSNSATFASGIETLAELDMGATEVRDGGAQDSTVGRYELRFRNWQNDATYRYVRAYTFVGGTVATGVNYSAFVSIDQGC